MDSISAGHEVYYKLFSVHSSKNRVLMVKNPSEWFLVCVCGANRRVASCITDFIPSTGSWDDLGTLLHGHSKGRTSWKPLWKSKRENYRNLVTLNNSTDRAQSWEDDFHGVSSKSIFIFCGLLPFLLLRTPDISVVSVSKHRGKNF